MRADEEMRRIREAWLSVLSHHYDLSPDEISYDEYVRCGKERGPDVADELFLKMAKSERPVRDAAYADQVAAREAYDRGEGPRAEAAAAHATKVAAFEASRADRAHLPPEGQALAAMRLECSRPCAPPVGARSPWERCLPLPPRPYLGFDLELLRLPSTDPDFRSVQQRLCASESGAFDVCVWRIRHEVRDAKYKLEADRIGNEKLLWHSSSNTDPSTLVFSDYPFDKTRGAGGSYGSGLYFSEHAIYGCRILPCRVSRLDEADGISGALPACGDDVMLVRKLAKGCDDLATYEVISIDADGNAKLDRLPWSAKKRERPATLTECRLGDGTAGTTLWRYADRRYSILAAVALGNVKEYDSECDDRLERAPDGFHSVSGTEQDLNIIQVLNRRKWYPQWKREFASLQEKGKEYGRQHVVYHESQAKPQFIVRYRRKRVADPVPPRQHELPIPPTQPPSSKRRRAPSSEETWLCPSCQFTNDSGANSCINMVKQGGRPQTCGRVRS
mmetsp:Transcript_18840/g.48419  ORF Transcript_18840/g.48419 Transcript_18840/m.48419 type:complete len:504 (+) Transcript_18840:670-2181(+)